MFKQRPILIVHKANHSQAKRLGEEIASWLEQRGHKVLLHIGASDWASLNLPPLDFAIVLGGDGTMLGVARNFPHLPLLGINFGNIGRLTVANPNDWQATLLDFLAGKAKTIACISLQWQIKRQGEIIKQGLAINDVVIHRTGLARLAKLRIAINGEYLSNLRSDGLIIASPVGSSGYNASANGPILHPELEALIINPLCAFYNILSPMVIKADNKISVEILDDKTDCLLTLDGQVGIELKFGDIIEVVGDPKAAIFVSNDRPFFETLQNCGLIRHEEQKQNGYF